MRAITALPIALLVASLSLPAFAQVVSSKGEARAAIEGSFRERSNSLGRDIRSEFRRGGWVQSELSGRQLGRSSYFINRRGQFCRRGQGCMNIQVIGRDFALVNPKTGRVGKRFRRLD